MSTWHEITIYLTGALTSMAMIILLNITMCINRWCILIGWLSGLSILLSTASIMMLDPYVSLLAVLTGYGAVITYLFTQDE